MLFLGNSKILLSTHDHDPNCSSQHLEEAGMEGAAAK